MAFDQWEVIGVMHPESYVIKRRSGGFIYNQLRWLEAENDYFEVDHDCGWVRAIEVSVSENFMIQDIDFYGEVRCIHGL